MISNLRTHGLAALAAWVIVAVFCPSVAAAQQTETPVAAAAQGPLAPNAVPSGTVVVAPAFWELMSGYEGDTQGSGYGFFGSSYVRPLRPGLAWTARATGNFLSYEFGSFEGTTRVRSPGVGASAGLQFGEKSFFRLMAGPELRWRRTNVTTDTVVTTARDTRLGVNVGAEAYANPTTHNNVHAIANYNTADRYTWGRVGFKEQISNRSWRGANAMFVGVEGIAQGNEDIRSTQAGAFFELTHLPAQVSVMFKAGFKRSTFQFGPGQTGPYFSVGFYHRLK